MKRFIGKAIFVGVLAAIIIVATRNPGSSAQSEKLDLLIRGGRLIDGTGSAAAVTDIGVKGDRIVFIGNAARERREAGRVIDATGLTVAPGFIDPHTHAAEDLGTPTGRSNQNYLFQGVTTVVTGNDGNGPLPIGTTLTRWQDQGIGTNAVRSYYINVLQITCREIFGDLILSKLIHLDLRFYNTVTTLFHTSFGSHHNMH